MKLKIGKSMESGRELFIAYGDEDAINNHIGFYGKSGMGKTYTLNALSQQCLQRNYACIIIDYSQSYSDQNTRDENIRIIDVDEYQIGIFRVRTSRGERENPFKYASRVSSILQRMFKLGEVQKDFVFQIAKAERESGRELSFETLRSKDLAGKKSEQFRPDDMAIKKYRQENDKKHMDLKKLNRGQCLVTARYVRKDGKRTRRASLFVEIEK